MAHHLKFWDYDSSATLACPACSWCGPADGNEDWDTTLIEVRCGSCGTMLLLVPFPTFDETREAAAAGNAAANADLSAMEKQEASYLWRQQQVHLSSPEQLPELPDEPLIIVWDATTEDGKDWQTLSHDGCEIWREPAYYESYKRFEEIFKILRARYGTRLAEVRPTPSSECWIYGDKIGASAVPANLNASLAVDMRSRSSEATGPR